MLSEQVLTEFPILLKSLEFQMFGTERSSKAYLFVFRLTSAKIGSTFQTSKINSSSFQKVGVAFADYH